MCGRWVRFFRNGCAPTYRALASACSPAPATPTVLNNKGLGLTPRTPLGGELSCSLLPFAVLQTTITCHSKAQLRLRLWVLAACAGPSTTSKGFEQTSCPSRPVRVAPDVHTSTLKGFDRPCKLRENWPKTIRHHTSRKFVHRIGFFRVEGLRKAFERFRRVS